MKKYLREIVLMSFLYTLFLVLFQTCKEESNPVSSVIKTHHFKVNFENDYCDGEGWVILNSSDGLSTIKSKKFFKNAEIDFGKLDEDSVTFSIIYTLSGYSRKIIEIKSFIKAPIGEYTFKNRFNEKNIQAKLNITFPEGNYSELRYSLANSYKMFGNSIESNHKYFEDSLHITKLNSDNTLSLYGYVYNKYKDSGYCGWKLNEPFDENSNNNIISLKLDRKLSSKTLQTNIPFNSLSLKAYPNNSNDFIMLYGDGSSQQITSHQILYPATLNAYKYVIFLYSWDNSSSYYFSKTVNNLPTDLTIPSYKITAQYNLDYNVFENIKYQGKFDALTAFWYYSDSDRYVRWTIYESRNAEYIKQPEMPDEVKEWLNPFNIEHLKPWMVGLLDWEAAKSFGDYIRLIYINKNSNVEDLNNYYIYNNYINN